MPQKTNLNINPYYDDFDKDDNFYKVLFKPGYPIQARELTTLQSILQNQIETFGSHMFKEGSMVIPGGITYDSDYDSVKINSTHLGIDVNIYADKLVGKKLRGQTSGVVATVDKWLDISESAGITHLTLFVKYINANNNNEAESFDDGEVLIVEENFTYGNTTVNSGESVASLIDENATALGTAVGVTEGVFFVRGTFVYVPTEKLVLDAYSNSSSYRVGFTVLEELVTAKDDDSLYDNAKGYSNYAAPGGDRLKISLVLSKKSLTDFNDTSFVEIVRIQGGDVKKIQNKSDYNLIRDYFAKRTYEESGDYAVDTFFVEVSDCLDDGISTEGSFTSNQITDQGNVPSEDLLSVKVSPGRAYVKGFDVDLQSTTIIDVEKPRDKREVSSALVPFNFGTLLRVNNVQGTPILGINNNLTVKLYDQRRGSATDAATGNEIGQARVYSFGLSDAPYSNASSSWNLYLFDVQTYTFLTLNSTVTTAQVPASSYIRGLSSGASGYVTTAPAGSDTIELTQTSGTFVEGEQILINETTELSRSINSIRVCGIEDVKSIYQDTSAETGYVVDFIADTVLQKRLAPNFSINDAISISSNTVTSPGKIFTGIKTESIIRYQIPGTSEETFNRVTAVSADGTNLTVASVESISSVCDGTVGVVTSVPFSIGVPLVPQSGGLYSPIGERNIASVNLSGSNIIVSSQITEQETNALGEMTINVTATGISSAFFEAFDAERYSIFYQNGDVEDLSSDQVTFGSNGQSITFSGLTPSQTNPNYVTVNTTVRKNSITSKSKIYTRSEKLTIDKSISGVSTQISGLTQGSYYGTRVEDKEICLNFPDVSEVIAVYESYNDSAPTLDSIEFPSGLSLDTSSILGERIVGSDNGAVAQIVTRSSATKVEIVYLNSKVFKVGELVKFEESNIESLITTVNSGNYQNVRSQYVLNKATREQYYDYSRLVKVNRNYTPSHQLLVIFNRYSVPSNDNGNVYTVNSYSADRFKNNIPSMVGGLRASDTLDFRPRVAEFTSTTSSPFDFASRNFATAGVNPTLVVTPSESSLIGYDYYLPRIDKVVLDKEGDLIVIKGSSSPNPQEPSNYKDAMEIATISLPGYLYNPENAIVSLVDNRRYTMRDIGAIEDRLENLEVATSLTLLELDTQSLQIRDPDGLDRFKSGFFVDDFKDSLRSDVLQSTALIDEDRNELTTLVELNTIPLQLALDPSINEDSADNIDNILLDPNVQKTGNLVTLKYEKTTLLEQPYATRVENVNPFHVVEYTGNIQIVPTNDTWVRTININGGTRLIGPAQDIVNTISLPFGTRRGGGRQEIQTREIQVVTPTRTVSDTIQVSVQSSAEQFIRSRNVFFKGTSLRPYTRHYPFFDSSSNLDIIPKLLEISMISGVFEPGEVVRGFDESRNIFTCRVARPDHKEGPRANPSKKYSLNPYNNQTSLPTSYSASSSVLNLDIVDLQTEVLGRFNGYVTTGMILVGETSGAQASVSDIRLVADRVGDIYGSMFFRDPLTSPPPPRRFTTGAKTFRLTSSSTNIQPLRGSKLISSADGTYTATGRVDRVTRTRVIVREVQRVDPLAQTFTVDENGAFLTDVELFFANKDEVENLHIEIRTVELGIPTRTLVSEYATVEVDPSEIETSRDASIGTTITFPSPIYLESDTEYALVILSPNSVNYELWVSRMGERTVTVANLPDAESIIATQAYTGGSLYKSQNGTVWTASQEEDLKFKLTKASFVSGGTAYFYNYPLIAENLENRLPNDSIRTLPRKLKVGVDSNTLQTSILTIGRKVADGTLSSSASGFIEGVGGGAANATTNLVGVGYSNGTFTGVPLYSITGSGTGAQGTVTFASGKVSGNPTITASGSGYSEGDILGITTANVSKGTGAQITVSSVTNVDTLYLTNVQGEEFTTGQDLVYYEGSTAVSMASTHVTSSSLISDLFDGRVIEVNHLNHGMHSDTNIVSITGIEPNTIPASLTQPIGINTNIISVADTTRFSTFEGISTSQGYLKVKNEIIFYDSITAGTGDGSGTLGIGTRGVDGSLSMNHSIGDLVYPYQLNGVSLTKINTQHNLPTNTTLKSLRDYDTYHLQISRGARTTGDSQLSFTDENTVGGGDISASRNIQFNTIIPNLNVRVPGEATRITSQIRTVSGTSASGSESSFIDQGFENVELDVLNTLESTRLIASEDNETVRLTSLPKNKSFTLSVSMTSNNANLSPQIDISNTLEPSITVSRSGLNRPISNYANSNVVKQVEEDPHMSVYVTNPILLSQPATSLRVLISAYRHSSVDFRVLYQLIRSDSSEIEQTYELFPGYDNLLDNDNDGFGDVVIDSKLNNGRPDRFVPSSNEGEFLDYQFSADNLEQFNGFRIKLVMSGTNEAKQPRFRDLRAIALA
jgi:hypothetical protein